MDNFRDILTRLRPLRILAKEISADANTIYQWKRRDKIPASKWKDIADAGQRRGYFDITIEKMAEIEARKKKLKEEEEKKPGSAA